MPETVVAHPQVSPLAFYLLAALVLFPALAVVLGRNLFHAGIALITCFLGVAGLYITLDAPFLAGMQVLVYAGAIAVILLFAFMLTHNIMHSHPAPFQPWAGLVSASLAFLMLAATILNSPWPEGLTAPRDDLGVATLARGYLTEYFVPFQLVALMLLASLIGAIVVTRKEELPPDPDPTEEAA